jgi:hypothetical protein
MSSAREIQLVTIHLRDGRELKFSGPAQVTEEELRNSEVRIKEVAISPPRLLPSGYQFEMLPSTDGEKDG